MSVLGEALPSHSLRRSWKIAPPSLTEFGTIALITKSDLGCTMAVGSKSERIRLYDALLEISRRLDPTAVEGSHRAITQLKRALREEKLVAKCDFAKAPVGWEPNERSFRMPVKRTRRMDVPAPRWDDEEEEIYWRGSMLCVDQQDCTDVFGRITVRRSDVDRLWPLREHATSGVRKRGLAVADEKLFKLIDQRLEKEPHRSVSAICRELADEQTADGKKLVLGSGTPESRAKRIERGYGRYQRSQSDPKQS